MLLVDALNSGGGGAQTLINCLYGSVKDNPKVRFLLNTSIELDGSNVLHFAKTLPFTKRRVQILAKQLGGIKTANLFCLGNVPPPRRVKAGRVFTYFHNALILSSLRPNGLPLAELARLSLLSYFVSRYRSNTDEWFVQTEFIKCHFCEQYGIAPEKVSVLPFFDEQSKCVPSTGIRDIDFVYVSGASPHKNHQRLFQAWSILAEEYKYYPSLAVTIGDIPANLARQLEVAKRHGARIMDFGKLSSSSVGNLLGRSRWCVYPSLVETIGLGLLESAQQGCGVLSADVGYSHEIIANFTQFDPYSAKAIANAVFSTKDREPIPAMPVIHSKMAELKSRLFQHLD
jgi:glycosyltransferase involved in cell wall biosynthesis